MVRNWRRHVWLGITLCCGVSSLLGQTPPSDITIVAEEGRSSLPVSEFSGKPMVSLGALAELVDAEIRPASEKAVQISARGTVARISDESSFVPVGGKTVLLQSPPRLVAGEWFVPLDFLSRVLPSLSSMPMTYRDRERMLILGESFPRLEVRAERDPSYTRVEVVTSRRVPIELSQNDGEIVLTIQAPYLDTDFAGEDILDGIVERIRLERKERHYEVSVKLGAWFGTLKAFERDYPEHGVVLDLLKSRVPGAGRSTHGEVLPEHPDTVSERTTENVDRDRPELETIELPPNFANPEPDPLFPMPGEPARVRIVAIDPGHGGAEIGAEGGGGLVEKDVVLSIARQLKTLLQQRLGVLVILTRDGDRNLALDERAAIANNNKADVFLSIHADASPRRDARGSSVYFLSYSSSGAGTRGSVAAVQGGASSGNGSELDFILWDMAQASQLSRSSQLAEILQEELQATTGGGKVNRGIKQNTFRVLKGATMPAVLVELGFISNPEEESLLATREHQQQLAEALYRGLLRYKDAYEQEPKANRSVSSRSRP